jgi:hypothetical protein
MKNKQLVITLGVLGAIAVASYIAYTILSKGSSAVTPKKTTVATAKQVAAAKQAAIANPNDAAAQAAYLNLGKSLVTALMATNKTATPATTPAGTPCTNVDASGNYIENGDPSTLYNADGSVKGDLDPNTGMFVDKNGNIVANSDGTPASVNKYGNVVEPDGSTYALDGTPIQQNRDGSYTELNTDGSLGQSYTANGDVITQSTASTYDPTADPNSPEYIDQNMAAIGKRSSFGNTSLHSLLKK